MTDDVDVKPEGTKDESARSTVSSAYGHAKDSAQHGLEVARDKVSGAYGTAAEKTSAALSTAKDTAGSLREKAAAGIEENPLAALIGGLALGALAGVLVPRSQKEIEALAPLGERLRTAASEATRAGREAGVAKLSELGFHKEDLLDKARDVIEQAIAAARSSGTAAASAATDAAKDAVQS